MPDFIFDHFDTQISPEELQDDTPLDDELNELYNGDSFD